MKYLKIVSLLIISCFCAPLAAQERIEAIPFGNFDSWVTRYIEESKIIGGKTKTIYAVAKTDTIRENTAFVYGVDGNPWACSNVWAHVAGIHKASGTTTPERRGDGFCTRLDVRMEEVVVFGFIDIKVLVAGTLFTGSNIEPIRTASDPYQNIDFGVPFTGRPIALMVDYKAKVSPERFITVAKGFGKPKNKEGWGCPEIYMFLQKRWEDEEGNIYSKRVGTAYHRIEQSQPTWHNDFRIPVHYGDITKEPFYRAYMQLEQPSRAMNSKGKIVQIQEIGWADANETPTHMIIMLTSDFNEAFVAHEGNTLWVDNVRLVY